MFIVNCAFWFFPLRCVRHSTSCSLDEVKHSQAHFVLATAVSQTETQQKRILLFMQCYSAVDVQAVFCSSFFFSVSFLKNVFRSASYCFE